MAEKSVAIKCSCGTVVRMSRNSIGLWRNTKCPGCNKTIRMKKERMKTVVCQSCQHEVVFDVTLGNRNLCPICGKQLDPYFGKPNSIKVYCPRCSHENTVRSDDLLVVCEYCKNEFDVQHAIHSGLTNELVSSVYIDKDYGKSAVQKDKEFLIWECPDHRFPYGSRVKVEQGTTALLLQNGRLSDTLSSGSYLLQDCKLSESEKMTVAASGQNNIIFDSDIYFVNTTVTKAIHWGTNRIIAVHDKQGDRFIVTARGSVRVTVSDAFALLDYLGYGTLRMEDAVFEGDLHDIEREPSELVMEIRKQINDTIEELLEDACSEWACKPERLRDYSARISRKLAERLNKSDELLCRGLHIDSINIEDLAVELAEDTMANRDFIAKVEQRITWKSDALDVHMPNDSVMRAKVTFTGNSKLCVFNAEKLFEYSKIVELIQKKADGEGVAHELGETIKTQINNVLTDNLQYLIDQNGIDIVNLTPVYEWLRRKIKEEINEYFDDWGLRVDGITIAVCEMELSDALRKSKSLIDQRTEIELNREKANLERNVSLTEEREQSHYEISKYAIKRDQEERIDEIDLTHRKNSIDRKREHIKLDKENYALDDSAKRYKEEVDTEHSRYRELLAQDADRRAYECRREDAKKAHEERMQDMAYTYEEKSAQEYLRHEEDKERKNYQYQDQYDAQDFAFETWIRNNRLHEADLDARLAAETKIVEHGVATDRTEKDAQRAEEMRVAIQHSDLSMLDRETQRKLDEIMRSIALSNLELQDKIRAYARIAGNQQFEDELQHSTRTAQVKTSTEREAAQMRNILTGEAIDLYQKLTGFEDTRRHERDQAEYVREMEKRRFEVAHEMELMQQNIAYEDRYIAAAERVNQLENELARLKLQFENEQIAGRQHVEVHRIDTEAKTVSEVARYQSEVDIADARSRAETGCALATATGKLSEAAIRTADQAERDRVTREQSERIEMLRQEQEKRQQENAKRAEQIYMEKLGLDHVLNEMKLKNERAYNAGRAVVDAVAAHKMDDEQMDRINADFERLLNSISNGAVERIRDSIKSAGKNVDVVIRQEDKSIRRYSDDEQTLRTSRHRKSGGFDKNNLPHRFCIYCGMGIEEVAAKFCPKCGALLLK